MKKVIFAMFILIALMFVACNSGVDTPAKSTFKSDTSKGKVTIEVYSENPERAVSSGNFYVIFLNGDVIGRGTIIVAGAVWTFQPTYGATESFTGTFIGGTLIIIVIPSLQGPITDFEAEENEESDDIDVVGFWDGPFNYNGEIALFTFEFKKDGTFVLTVLYQGEILSGVTGIYSVSGNEITIEDEVVTVKDNQFTSYTVTGTPENPGPSVVFTRR